MPHPDTDAAVADDRASPSRPTWLEIDLAAVRHNFQVARRATAPGVALFPVVKADGYGLGAVPIACALAAAGADGFCVATLEEGERLRRAGIRQPVVVLSGPVTGQAQRLRDGGFQPFIHDLETARSLADRAGGGAVIPLFVKVDSGMARLGLDPTELPGALAGIAALPGLAVAGIVSHLACADALEGDATAAQVRTLHAILADPGTAPWRGRVSLANSAGILGHPASHFDWARPGILLYGASPFFPARTAAADGLQPVLGWHTRIIQLRHLAAATPLGYGYDHVTRRPSRIALLPVGYADGYSRRLGNRGRVVIDGRRLPVVGRVSMDLTAVDVTDLPGATVGSPVSLLGGPGAAAITLEEMAAWMETIPYEVMGRLGQRLPRHYLRP